jgi:hypothetical protein
MVTLVGSFLIFLLKPQAPTGHRINDGRPLCEIIPSSRRTMTKGNVEERVHRIRTTTLPDPSVISLASRSREVHPEAYQ